MKTFKFTTTVVTLARYAKPIERVSTKGAVRTITHKIELVLTDQMEKAIKDAETLPDYLRKDSKGKESRVTFGVVNSAGNFVMSLDKNAVQKLVDVSGVSLGTLTRNARGAKFMVDFIFRLAGEEAIDSRTKEVVPIVTSHLSPQNYNIVLSERALDRIETSAQRAEIEMDRYVDDTTFSNALKEKEVITHDAPHDENDFEDGLGGDDSQTVNEKADATQVAPTASK